MLHQLLPISFGARTECLNILGKLCLLSSTSKFSLTLQLPVFHGSDPETNVSSISTFSSHIIQIYL